MRPSLQPATQYAPWYYELARRLHAIPGGQCRVLLGRWLFAQVDEKTIFVSDIFPHSIHYEGTLLDSLLPFCDNHGITVLLSQPIHSTQNYIQLGFVSHLPAKGIMRYRPENQKTGILT